MEWNERRETQSTETPVETLAFAVVCLRKEREALEASNSNRTSSSGSSMSREQAAAACIQRRCRARGRRTHSGAEQMTSLPDGVVRKGNGPSDAPVGPPAPALNRAAIDVEGASDDEFNEFDDVDEAYSSRLACPTANATRASAPPATLVPRKRVHEAGTLSASARGSGAQALPEDDYMAEVEKGSAVRLQAQWCLGTRQQRRKAAGVTISVPPNACRAICPHGPRTMRALLWRA